MTKKSTKRALLMSGLALLLCVSMLIGSTYAWFTDSVTSGNNKIVSGNLDVELWHCNNNKSQWGHGYDEANGTQIEGDTELFLNVDGKPILWEPGASAGETFRVKNAGSLALKFKLYLRIVDATATPEGKTLADVLNMQIIEMQLINGNQPAEVTGGLYYEGLLGNGYVMEGELLPGETTDFNVALDWNPSANDNDYNVPGGLEVTFAVDLMATQLTYEKDFFDDSYDAGAKYPVEIWDGSTVTVPTPDANGVYRITTPAELVGMMEVTGNSIYSGKTIVLENNIDLGGRTVKGIGGISTNFAGIFDGQGYTISNFKIDATDRAYYAGLFNQVSHGGTIKNLTVKNATVSGTSMVGAVASSLDNSAVIDNCKAIDCTVVGVKKVGAVVGYTAGSTVTNNYAENCKVFYGEKEGGEVLGFKNTGSTVNNNTANNVVVKLVVSNDEQLNKAINNPSVEVITVASGEYGVIDVRVNRNLTIVAADRAIVKLAGINGQTNNNTSNVTIKGITIDNSLQTEGWYTGTSQKMKVCVGVWGGNYTFEDCVFNVTGEKSAETGVMSWWTTNAGTMDFIRCTFNGGTDSARAMQIYGNYDLKVEGCSFNTAKDYSIKYVGSEGRTATFKGNTVNNTVNFVQTGSALYAGAEYALVFDGNTLASGINHVYVDNVENQTITVNGINCPAIADAIY